MVSGPPDFEFLGVASHAHKLLLCFLSIASPKFKMVGFEGSTEAVLLQIFNKRE